MYSYLENGTVYIPETKITHVDASHTYKAMRGYAYILAVFKDNSCIGWIDIETLGYKSVKDWLKQ